MRREPGSLPKISLERSKILQRWNKVIPYKWATRLLGMKFSVNPNLGGGGGGGGVILPPSWISFNNSKTVKAGTLEFCSIQLNSVRDIHAKFGISSLQILGKTQTGVFPISGNSRTSDDMDMKLRPLTRLDKRNKTTSKKFDVDVMSTNYDVIVIFRIFGQFRAVQRADSGHRVCNSYVFSNSNLLSYKN